MIKNIIFDMGSVLLRFDSAMFLDRANVTGSDRILLQNRVFRSAEWAMTDWGTLSEEEACEKMCARLPERLHALTRSFLFDWDKPIVPVEGMADLVKELKDAGCGIYLLSNASSRQHEYWPRIPGSEYFDGTLISADIQKIKPNPEIYEALFEKFALIPEECLFIDDLGVNIAGGRMCGMEGILFTGDVSELRKELSAYLNPDGD